MTVNAMNDRARLAEAIFRPRAIALIGATADQTKNTARAQRVLTKSGYGGRILPINPKAAEIMGDAAYPDIRAAPAQQHQAVSNGPRSSGTARRVSRSWRCSRSGSRR